MQLGKIIGKQVKDEQRRGEGNTQATAAGFTYEGHCGYTNGAMRA